MAPAILDGLQVNTIWSPGFIVVRLQPTFMFFSIRGVGSNSAAQCASFALLILDVEVNLRVRIRKIPLGDGSGDRNRFIQLVRDVTSVMGESKIGRSKQRGGRRKIANAPVSHTGSV